MAIILLVAIIVRFWLLPLPAFSIDMNDWIAWADHLLKSGPGQFYQTTWCDYLPGYLYVLWLLARLHQIIPQFPYEILMKIPSVLADLALGYLIFKLVSEEKKAKKWAFVAAALFLFTPALVFNSSIWGQIDGVFSLLLVASIILMIKNRQFLGFCFLGVSFLIKPQVVIFLPLFLLHSLGRRQAVLKTCIGGAVFMATIFFLSLPFFTHDPILGLPKLILKSASVYPYTSVFAMNFWGIFGTWRPDSEKFLTLPYLIWGTILLFIGLSFAWGIFWRGKGRSGLFLAASLLVLAFFMLPTRVHERWLYAFFPFFLVYAARKKDIILMGIYLVMSAIHFLNLFFVYTYYMRNIWPVERFTEFVNLNFGRLALFSFIVYLLILVLSFRKERYGKN